MDKGQSSRPDDGKCGTFTVASQHAYFERWLRNLEELNRERFSAIKESITKAESAQTAYNERSNEFRGQLDDQAKRLMARDEALSKFLTYDEKIEDCKREIVKLRETQMEIFGRTMQKTESRATTQWGVGTVIALVAVLVTVITPIVVAAIELLRHNAKP
jgi:hypothetical protein